MTLQFNRNISQNGFHKETVELFFDKSIYTLDELGKYLSTNHLSGFISLPEPMKTEVETVVCAYTHQGEYPNLVHALFEPNISALFSKISLIDLHDFDRRIINVLAAHGYPQNLKSLLELFLFSVSLKKIVGLGQASIKKLTLFFQTLETEGLSYLYDTYLPVAKYSNILNRFCTMEDNSICKICRLFKSAPSKNENVKVFQKFSYTEDDKKRLDDLPLSVLSLPQRAYSTLNRHGIFTVLDLLKNDEAGFSFRNMSGCGQKTSQAIYDVLDHIYKGGIQSFFQDLKHLENPPLKEVYHRPKAKDFLSYCYDHGYENLNDLAQFDFRCVQKDLGYSEEKAASLCLIYYHTQQSLQNKFGIDTVSFAQVDPSLQFLRYSVLKYFGVGQTFLETAHQENHIQSVRDIYDMAPLDVFRCFRFRNFSILKQLAPLFEDDIISLTKKIADELLKSEDAELFYDYLAGKTYQVICDSQRSKGRKICLAAVRTRIIYFIERLACFCEGVFLFIVSGRDVPYLTRKEFERLADILGYKKEFFWILLNASHVSYLDFADVYLYLDPDSDSPKTVEELCSVLQKLIMEFMDMQTDLTNWGEKLSAYLKEKGYPFMTLEAIKKMPNGGEYSIFGDTFTTKELTPFQYYLNLLKDEYPFGIRFSDKNTIQRLREIARESVPTLKLPNNDRGLLARLSPNLIFIGKMTYIDPRWVHVSKDSMEFLIPYIEAQLDEKLYYYKIFDENKDSLDAIGISSPALLHGLLSYYFKDQYDFRKNYLLKKNSNEGRSIALFDPIRKELEASGLPMTFEAIREKYSWVTNSIIRNFILGNDDIISWDNGSLNSVKNIRITPDEKATLSSELDLLFEEKYGYLSISYCFQTLYPNYTSLFKKNHINSCHILFNFLSYEFGDKYYLKSPHLFSLKYSHSKDIVNVILNFIPDFYRYPLNDQEELFLNTAYELSKVFNWSTTVWKSAVNRFITLQAVW